MAADPTSDIQALESDIVARIAAAADEAALEAERVAALGKKGVVSELLKTLGAMPPEARQVMGPALNGLKDRVTEAHRRPPRRPQGRASSSGGSPPTPSTSRCRCAPRRSRPAASIRSAR